MSVVAAVEKAKAERAAAAAAAAAAEAERTVVAEEELHADPNP